MKNKLGKRDYSVGFTYAVILCSMLLAFPFKISGMEAMPVILFLLCMVWMVTDILQIKQGKKKPRLQYRRLDLAVVIFLVYEVGLIAVSLTQKIEENEPGPDYSWKLLMIDLALLYLLVMEAAAFRAEYLDMILYGGLAIMALLLLGYLFDPQIGEKIRFWEDSAALSSYLIMVGIVAALQYCQCADRRRSIFYVMSAGIAFFLLACNHSVISFWLVAYALLTIPVLLRPTACLCKRAVQMLFLFLLIVSSMGLLANDTGLFLRPVHYDAEHSVCLNMIAAAYGVAFFYCWYRKPEDMPQDRIVMRGFYKLNKLVLRGMLLALALFVSGGTLWGTLDSERFGFRGVSGFAAPLLEEAGQNQGFIFACMREQGVTGVILGLVLLVLLIDRMIRSFGWDKPVRGTLCVIAVSLLPQVFLWEMAPNILPLAALLLSGAISGGSKSIRQVEENSKKQRRLKLEEIEPEETGLEEIELEEIVLEEVGFKKSEEKMVKKEVPKKNVRSGGRKKLRVKKGKGRERK